MLDLAAAGISAAGGLINGAIQQNYNLQNMRRQNEYNKQAVERQIEAQKELFDYTGYVNRVKQMKAAGLNPALMYQGGSGQGGTTGNTSAVGVGLPAAPNPNIMGLAIEGARLPKQLKSQSVDIAKNELQLDIDTALKAWKISQGKSESDLAGSLLGIAMNNNKIKNVEANVAEWTEDIQIWQKQADLLQTQSQNKLTNEQANAVIEGVLQKWTEIGNDTQRIENELRLRLKQMDVQMDIAIIQAIAGALTKAIPSTNFSKFKGKTENYSEQFKVSQ